MMTNRKHLIYSFVPLVAFLVLARIIPHPPNFTPILGMAVFAPYFCRDYFISLALPLSALVLTDIILGFHGSMIWVYVSVGLIVALAHLGKLYAPTLARVTGLVVGGPALFFIITNFGVWLAGGLYPMTAEGLMACYIAALPFFGNSLVSTILTAGIIYMIIQRFQRRSLSRI